MKPRSEMRFTSQSQKLELQIWPTGPLEQGTSSNMFCHQLTRGKRCETGQHYKSWRKTWQSDWKSPTLNSWDPDHIFHWSFFQPSKGEGNGLGAVPIDTPPLLPGETKSNLPEILCLLGLKMLEVKLFGWKGHERPAVFRIDHIMCGSAVNIAWSFFKSQVNSDGGSTHQFRSSIQCKDNWGITENFEAFWSILKHFEAFWSILKHFEAFWSILKHFEAFWSTLYARLEAFEVTRLQ